MCTRRYVKSAVCSMVVVFGLFYPDNTTLEWGADVHSHCSNLDRLQKSKQGHLAVLSKLGRLIRVTWGMTDPSVYMTT